VTSTPRIDSITAGGAVFFHGHIRLADGLELSVQTKGCATVAEKVALPPGLAAPPTKSWANSDEDDGLEDWLTGGDFQRLYFDVPVQAIRDLIEQHGGEHADQDSPAATAIQKDETAENFATRALAQWGIAAHLFEDEKTDLSWLVIGRDQSVHRPEPGLPRLALYLYDQGAQEVAPIDCDPEPWNDAWRVMAVAADGTRRHLLHQRFDQIAECVEAIADWITTPGN
jgi:hypothetical protein